MNNYERSVRGSRVVVLGVAYKRDIDDVRESPALDVISLLREKGADVVFHDPFVPSIRLENNVTQKSEAYSVDLLKNADCVVIITDHTDFNWNEVAQCSKLIIDTRNVLNDVDSSAEIITL